ncbi:MAG TPA: YqeG family HAD IIIA-type phosphatase [Tenericutes bacterium]|nr:YqeG family HAD IIIA-type phosphatase [Mycoplasmatota bacterium]
MDIFIPDMYQKSIYTIDYEKLKERGIKCLLFDLDNTLIPARSSKKNEKLKDFFDELKQYGFKIYIFSNSPKRRVSIFADDLGIEYCYSASKPLKKKFLKIVDDNDLDLSEVAIIGDQLLTDVLGGNRVGITTILINPISIKDGVQTLLNRTIEKYIIKKLTKKDLFVKGRYYE